MPIYACGLNGPAGAGVASTHAMRDPMQWRMLWAAVRHFGRLWTSGLKERSSAVRKDIFALSDSKGSILDILDETCLARFSSATDASLVGKALSGQGKHQRLKVEPVVQGRTNSGRKNTPFTLG